jgi:endonuclease YncB( thermonuclease family)
MNGLHDHLRILRLRDIGGLEFKLYNLSFYGKVVDVYDGDTCKIIILNPDDSCKSVYTRYNCRLEGIDTPEITSKTDAAFKARNRLIQLATNCKIELNDKSSHSKITKLIDNNTKLITVDCFDMDKYGRLLVKLKNCEDDLSCTEYFNQILIDEKLANEYQGGTKLPFKDVDE